MARYVRKYCKVRERCLIRLNTAKTDRGSRYQHSLYARICDKAKFLSRLLSTRRWWKTSHRWCRPSSRLHFSVLVWNPCLDWSLGWMYWNLLLRNNM